MKNILLLSMVLLFALKSGISQENPEERTIQTLYERLANVEEEEREKLKKQIEDINSLLNNGVIDKSEADGHKLRAAEERTLKIEERRAVLLETITYLERRESKPKTFNGPEIFLDIDSYFMKKDNVPPPNVPKEESFPHRLPKAPRTLQVPENKKFRNTTSLDLVFATGLSNTVREGITWQDIEDEENYSFYGSRFFEVGLALKTPLVKKNGLRLKYGISFQSNKLALKGNNYFTQIDGITTLAESDRYIGKSRFVVNNLIFPVHFEFGPTKKREHNDTYYYSTRNKFKIGIGSYAGLNLNARQWVQQFYWFRNFGFLGNRSIDGYDINNRIYGLSAYIGIGALSIYGKYDLNTIFENGALDEQFVSLGLRLDL